MEPIYLRHHADEEYAPTANPPDRLVLTVDEAAYLLNISRGLAYELVARGELPAIRLGRPVRCCCRAVIARTGPPRSAECRGGPAPRRSTEPTRPPR